MPYIIILIVLVIICITIFKSFQPMLKAKELYKQLLGYLDKNNLKYQVKGTKNDIFDVKIEINKKTYYLKFLIIPSYSEIQINNKTTWELKYGAKDHPGRVQPHRRYLGELSSFLGAVFEDDAIKFVVVSPKPKKVVKYINESEIIFVNFATDLYGTKIITSANFSVFKK